MGWPSRVMQLKIHHVIGNKDLKNRLKKSDSFLVERKVNCLLPFFFLHFSFFSFLSPIQKKKLIMVRIEIDYLI